MPARRIPLAAVFVWILFFGGALPVAAQFVVTSSDPPSATPNVADTARVTFHFSHPLPFSTHFLSGFTFAEPARRLSVRSALLDLDAQQRPTIVRLTVAHQAETDFVWVVYGLRNNGGTYLSKPYVLNYSTRPDIGSREFRGVISKDFDHAIALAPSFDLMGMISAGSYGRVDRDDLDSHIEMAGKNNAGTERHINTASTVEHLHPERTVVLLLEQHSVDRENWRVVAGGDVNEHSEFTLQSVRSGVYFPLAITFREHDTGFIEAFGFYDADRDHVPDAIDFSTGDVTNVPLVMYDFKPMSAFENLARADEAARSVHADNVLISVSASNVTVDGRGLSWTYEYVSTSNNSITSVVLDPISARITERRMPPEMVNIEPIASVSIDSPEAVAAAGASGGDEFRQAADGPTTISTILMDARESYRPARPGAYWAINHRAEIAGKDSTLTVFVEPVTGEVLVGRIVRSEIPAPQFTLNGASPFPNPLSDELGIPFSLSRPSDIEVEVYDALGRLVYTSKRESFAAGDHVFTWRAADVAPGLYLFRVRDTLDSITVTRAVRVADR